MVLTVVNGLDGLMHVHKAGCQHLSKAIKRSNEEFSLTADTREEVVTEIWSDFIPDWNGDLSTGWENTEFAPCVKIK